VIYRQTRLGESGRHFTIYKFRTMRDGAERPCEAVWAQDQDPRATGVGRVLRATHLDELPQLWNVLRGDMSIVGPRPERPEFIELLEAGVPFWSRRLLVRPGLTGWAQVNCGYAADSASAAEKLAYDFWYLRHSSLAVDLAVCVRTLALVLAVLEPRRLRVRRRAASQQPAP
jgi:lipopolysaccharide/colanic/teichoic acid biosynthesis glycosyltransferase